MWRKAICLALALALLMPAGCAPAAESGDVYWYFAAAEAYFVVVLPWEDIGYVCSRKTESITTFPYTL